MFFRNFVIISPLEKNGPFIWTNLNPFHPRMICAKFDFEIGWVVLEKIFKFVNVFFSNLAITSPKKKEVPFIWTLLNPLHCAQRCFVPSLVEIGSVVLEKKIL